MSMKTEEQSHNAAPPTIGLTRYKKKYEEGTTFMDDVKEYMDAIYSASMEEHKTCFQNTIDKMIEKSKEVAERFLWSEEVDNFVSQAENK